MRGGWFSVPLMPLALPPSTPTPTLPPTHPPQVLQRAGWYYVLQTPLSPPLHPPSPHSLPPPPYSSPSGAAVGRLVFCAADAEAWQGRGEQVVLVRVETSPEDVGGM